MGRRALAGQDQKIIQGHRRDEFFARMRRRGGTARLPNQGPKSAVTVVEEPPTEVAQTEVAEVFTEVSGIESAEVLPPAEAEAAPNAGPSEATEAVGGEQPAADAQAETRAEAPGAGDRGKPGQTA